MTVFDKARELGEMLLETKEGKRLFDAKFVFDADLEAQHVLFEYTQYRSMIQKKINDGSISQDELKESSDKINEMAENVKAHPVVGELVKAESEFNALVNSVLDVFKGTVTGENENKGCSGSCQSCGGCC